MKKPSVQDPHLQRLGALNEKMPDGRTVEEDDKEVERVSVCNVGQENLRSPRPELPVRLPRISWCDVEKDLPGYCEPLYLR